MSSKARALPDSIQDDPRWIALISRDARADGRFFYSVKTTGVYCRPSCAARTPRPQNVAFHASASDAEQLGFRACKRCKPSSASLAQEHATKVAALCRFIESAEQPPTLDELAERAGLSTFHLHRVFKAITGVTPRAYAQAQRVARVKQALGRGQSVTSAVYAAGYNSQGRFYEHASQVLGMTPTRFRKGGTDEQIRFAVGECSLGSILVAVSERGVCAISMGDDPQQLARDLERSFPRAQLIGADAAFEQLIARVVGFVEAPKLGLDLPLDVRGTAFRQRVWQALQKIPAGETLSYTQLAKKLGAPSAVRAVASACAANTLAVAIPCHRVVRSDGSSSGYRWGVERKRTLLLRESE